MNWKTPRVLDCSVILAGKCGNHCHSTTSFSESVVVAETTDQILGVLSLCDQERAQPPNRAVSFGESKV